ncbi:MAG: hypothetical protein ACXVAB_12320 [Thermodesulfobacteriota bacterium]
MGLLFHRLQWGCIFLLVFLMVGCSMNLAQKKPEGEKEFLEETCRLEKLARDHPETSVRAQSHLKLAFLFVNYRNPQLNYTRALQEMESYLSLAPTKGQTDDFKNWLSILKETEKLQTGLEKAQKANRSLREEVAGLKEAIERLKSLDRQMEEKRKLTK